MKTIKKYPIRLGLLVGKAVALGTLGLAVAGCVTETSPPGYYRAYPGDYSYYDYPQPGGSVTVIHENEQSNQPDHGDYDNHWDYGRRGNGNYHGEGDDDVHGD